MVDVVFLFHVAILGRSAFAYTTAHAIVVGGRDEQVQGARKPHPQQLDNLASCNRGWVPSKAAGTVSKLLLCTCRTF
jgi:hypothetical protein